VQLIDMREALRQALDEEMTRDESVFIMGEEVGDYKWGFKRVIDAPIAEGGFSGLGIGAAMTGLRPVIEFMSFNFSFVAADQIISNAAKMFYMSGGRFSVPIVFRGPNGAAAQVSCQHSHCVEAIYSNFPGLIIIAPSSVYDAKGLLKSAIRNNNPVLFLECELLYSLKQEIPLEEYLVPIGKAKVVCEGSDVTLITHGHMVHLGLEVVEYFKAKNIHVELIDLRTIKPLDIATLAQSIKKTHRAVIVEEGHIYSGIASEVIAQLQELVFDELDAPLMRVCQKETPMPYSKVLEKATLPTVERIIKQIAAILPSYSSK
jgi:pyruvate dehydrogenase E1 component beta subunit